MQSAAAQYEFVDRRIETFDPQNLLEVIRDGRFEHRLMEKGRFEVRHRRLVFANSSLDCGDYSPAFAVNGQFSADQICLGFTPRTEKPAWCNGFVVGRNEILCFSEGAELQFRNAPQTTWQALLVDRKELQEVAMILTGKPLKLPQRGTADFKVQSDRIGRLSSVIDLTLSSLASTDEFKPLGGANPGEEILNSFVRAMVSDSPGRTTLPPYRFAAMRRAEAFLKENITGHFSSRALCAATRMSERSIEMLFKEAYGVSPRTWFQIARLNAIRQDLLKGNSRYCPVSEVAVRWGFYHLGRFSAAYRSLFGELPSVTAGRKAAH
jgi:AraC family transcriptional regulator, ethanolamine operon transcriptional activator